MKLIECYVNNFGVLSDFSFNFKNGLNVIKEENGFGKSTLAAFIKSMKRIKIACFYINSLQLFTNL